MASQSQQAKEVLDLLGGRWTMAMLAEPSNARRRYHQLNAALDGISHKVLTDTLRQAERDGLVTRTLAAQNIDTAAVYEITPLGASVVGLVDTISHWADERWSLVEAARHGWEQRAGPTSFSGASKCQPTGAVARRGS